MSWQCTIRRPWAAERSDSVYAAVTKGADESAEFTTDWSVLKMMAPREVLVTVERNESLNLGVETNTVPFFSLALDSG